MSTYFSSLQNKKETFFQILVIVVIILGIVLRASKYLPGWSMRGDELAVTYNLLYRSAFDLATKPLDYEQAAPFGFLLLAKALIEIFGQSEYVLRLISFVSGCAALVGMYRLLARTGERYGNLFALCAFAFSDYLIYYSAELKQYSSDVLICIILAYWFHKHISSTTEKRDFIQLGIVGALAICFSHPAIFVAVALGFTLLLHYRHEKQKVIWLCIVGALWAGLFLAIYWILLRKEASSEYLITFWRNLNSFMPMPPWQDLAWFPGTIKYLFTTLASLSQPFLLILVVLYLFGLWMFYKAKQWQWIVFTSLTILINMLVSGFDKFPFHGRLIIYLLPLVFIVFGKGIDGLLSLFRNKIVMNAIYIVLFIALLSPAVSTANKYLFTQSYLKDDVKPIFAYVAENHQGDDLVYLYHYMNRQFEYYAPFYDLQGLTTITGSDYSRNGKKYQDELSSLPHGQRIWFLFSFVGDTKVDKTKKMNEREYMLNYLREHGTLLSEFYSTNNASSAHLFILK